MGYSEVDQLAINTIRVLAVCLCLHSFCARLSSSGSSRAAAVACDERSSEQCPLELSVDNAIPHGTAMPSSLLLTAVAEQFAN